MDVDLAPALDLVVVDTTWAALAQLLDLPQVTADMSVPCKLNASDISAPSLQFVHA